MNDRENNWRRWPCKTFDLVPHGRQHRPVFCVWHVMKSHRVPEHNVGVFHGTIGTSPSCKAVASPALDGIIASHIALSVAIGRHPELVAVDFRLVAVRRRSRLLFHPSSNGNACFPQLLHNGPSIPSSPSPVSASQFSVSLSMEAGPLKLCFGLSRD